MSVSLTTPTILSLKGVQAAFGLRWESLPAPSLKAAQVLLVKSMKQARVKYAVLNETDDRRFVGGLCLTGPTQRLSKTFSAVAWLAESRKRATLLVAELGPETFWVGVADPNVWLAGDSVGTRSEAGDAIDAALEHFERIGQVPEIIVVPTRPDGTAMQQYPDTARLGEALAQQGLNTPAFLPWESVFSAAPSRDALIGQMAGVDARTSWLFIGLAGLGAVAYLGHTLWAKHQESERLRIEAEQALLMMQQAPAAPSADEIEAERERRKARAIAAALQQQTDTPEPMEVIARCLASFNGIGVSLQGWALTELTCDSQGVAASWSSPASVGVLTLTESVVRHIESADPSSLVIDPSGRLVSATWKVEAPPTRGSLVVADLLVDDPMRRLLLTRSQLHVAGSMSAVSPWLIGAATPVDISYLDPALENEVNNPARFVQVLPPEGFRVAAVTVSGTGAWRLESLPLDHRAMTVRKIVFRPGQASAGLDRTPWSVEAQYVVQ